MTFLGHFPLFLPITFTCPTKSPLTPPTLHVSLYSPNHHQSLLNLHSRSPPAPTHHLRPPHSSTLHPLPFIPTPSLPIQPSSFCVGVCTNFFLLTTTLCLYRVWLSSVLGVGLNFFCRGLDYFWGCVSLIVSEAAHHLLDKSPD